jgi:Ca2+/Na+ antiporter
MEYLIWIGAVVTLAGLAGLIWCILKVQHARKKGLEDSALKAELQKVVALNLGALLLSAVGLMMVVVGIMLA